MRGEFFGTHSREGGNGGRETDRQSGVSKKRAGDTFLALALHEGRIEAISHETPGSPSIRLATEQGDCSRQDGRILMKGQNSIL